MAFVIQFDPENGMLSVGELYEGEFVQATSEKDFTTRFVPMFVDGTNGRSDDELESLKHKLAVAEELAADCLRRLAEKQEEIAQLRWALHGAIL